MEISIERNSRERSRSNLIAFIICSVCAIICVLLSQNEVYQDDWYIEASVDGFFGENNRSFFVLGTNYLITGIIYLLSLTGIRLFWLHILLIAMNFVSHFMISRIMIENLGKFAGSVLALMFGFIMGPLVSFEFQFTTTSAYVIASGCVAMLNAIQHKQGIGMLLFSGVWIILGAALRFPCLSYSIVFMGLVWLYQTIRIVLTNIKDKQWRKVAFPKVLCARLLPFLITLVLCFGFEISQSMIMDWVNPGFDEWNSVRTLVDDYEIPDYWSNEKEYLDIGISYNDFQLLQSWNNLDPEFFTQEKYEQILDIGKNTVTTVEEQKSPIVFLKQVLNLVSQNTAFWLCLASVVFVFLFANLGTVACALAMLCGVGGFSAYFTSIGRMIWRTEWPIWIAFLCAIVALICGEKKLQPCNLGLTRVKEKLFVLLICVVLVVMPFGRTKSLYEKYVDRYNNPNNVGRYLYAKAILHETPDYVTYNPDIAMKLLSENKDRFYFPLWSQDWLQQYPIYVMDTFRFFDVGAGENWGTLGQYMINLKPIQNNFDRYGIENPFRDLVKENVRIVARIWENTARAQEIYTYLQEHYYPDVSYCVETEHQDVIVSRFIHELPIGECIKSSGEVNVVYNPNTEVVGLAQLTVYPDGVEKYTPVEDEAYLRLTDSTGYEHYFALMRDEAERALIFNWVLSPEEEYKVDFVFNHNGQWYICEDCGDLRWTEAVER